MTIKSCKKNAYTEYRQIFNKRLMHYFTGICIVPSIHQYIALVQPGVLMAWEQMLQLTQSRHPLHQCIYIYYLKRCIILGTAEK